MMLSSAILALHITAGTVQGGSYIAMTTALLVVNWKTLIGNPGIHSPVAWVLPTVVGSPMIAWMIYQVRLGKRPKRYRPVVGPSGTGPSGSCCERRRSRCERHRT